MDHDLVVRYVEGKGLGVLSRRRFKAGAKIEVCRVYAIVRHRRAFEEEGLDSFELAWGHKKVAFATGHAHLYNHSDNPNVEFDRDLMRGVITVFALRDIKVLEELTHKYLCEPWWKE